MTETAGAALAGFKLLNDLKSRPNNGQNDHLRNAIARSNLKLFLSPVPTRHVYLPLVVGVDETGEVAEHDAVFMTQS